jgi:hypothetical protein
MIFRAYRLATARRHEVSDEKEISRIREEEARRGRRPQHLSEKEKLRRSKAAMMIALRRGNAGLFQQILIENGQLPGSDEYAASMKKFEDYQRGKR